MKRDEFYSEGKQVLTQEEHDIMVGAYVNAKSECESVMDNLREIITGAIKKMWEKTSATELVTESYTIINRFGDITVIDSEDEMAEEVSLDDIKSVNKLMYIVSEII